MLPNAQNVHIKNATNAYRQLAKGRTFVFEYTDRLNDKLFQNVIRSKNNLQ